jgi:hypothetical protein
LWAWEVTKKYKGTWKTESNFWLLFLGKVWWTLSFLKKEKCV